MYTYHRIPHRCTRGAHAHPNSNGKTTGEQTKEEQQL